MFIHMIILFRHVIQFTEFLTLLSLQAPLYFVSERRETGGVEVDG